MNAAGARTSFFALLSSRPGSILYSLFLVCLLLLLPFLCKWQGCVCDNEDLVLLVRLCYSLSGADVITKKKKERTRIILKFKREGENLLSHLSSHYFSWLLSVLYLLMLTLLFHIVTCFAFNLVSFNLKCYLPHPTVESLFLYDHSGLCRTPE